MDIVSPREKQIQIRFTFALYKYLPINQANL
jgi:hypothetical protein